MGKGVESLNALLVRIYLLLWNPNVPHPFLHQPVVFPESLPTYLHGDTHQGEEGLNTGCISDSGDFKNVMQQ
jgi:hypothetical protein